MTTQRRKNRVADKHVLGISGGKDSAALAVFVRQNHPELDVEYFFTDTGKELPEVYEFLGRLEGFLGKPILRLNPRRDFDFWLREYHNFLPSAQTRWCTRQLKLAPFEQWIRPMLNAGDKVTTYVAIRSDEEYREGYTSKHDNLKVSLPFRDAGIDKRGVMDILDSSGVGLPKYYDWRSRSGCTFCFFQQKIEWVRLKERHPEAFEEAKQYEKNALEHGSPFTWTQRESLSELEKPARVIQIVTDFERRKQRDIASCPVNPLRPIDSVEDIDEIFGEDEGGGACVVCHK
jgi:3'-phosphoadenosine 5'-phosphosulfate sulfotransferase (PAPS reductase)/FAD synthetase